MRRDLIGAPESRSARRRDQATVTLRQTRPAPHIPEQHVIGQPGRRRPPGAAASPTLTNYTQAFALLHQHPAGHSAGDRSAMTSSEPPQLVRLPDGRRLAFADYGPRDGAACIVLSGMPAPDSRRPGRSPRACWPTTACAWSGSTGYGRSDPNPRMSALGVADDLSVLCEVVDLDRVAVLGTRSARGSPWRVRSACPSGRAHCCCRAR